MTEYNHLTDPLRNKRITASMVGAILGNSPYMTRDDAMRRMVRDALGAPSEFEGNIATEYGNRNEAGAIMEFQMETGLTVEKARFVTKEDWAGATVDGWVSDGGILECKCPFSLRKGGQFKTLAEQPQYGDQVQFQLWVTDKPHAHFWQWCPADTRPEFVEPDQEWRDHNLPILRQFYAQFLAELEAPDDHLAPRRVTVDTPEAAKCVREWDELTEAIELATERRKDLLEQMVDMAGRKDALVAGRKLTLTKRAGSISYGKAIKSLLPDADLEKWRGAASESWGLK